MMRGQEELSESLEDYLEAIFRLGKKGERVRVKDIAAWLKVRNPSVSVALKALEKRGLVAYEPYGVIELTKEGRVAAAAVSERHSVLRYFFADILGSPDEIADDAACRIEHVIPSEAYSRLIKFVRYLGSASCAEEGFVKGFKAFVAEAGE
jgi:DtxR family Mn-dependent transcriptional regulator